MRIAKAAFDRGRNESIHLSKQNLSARRAELLELMQEINFGRVEELAVLNGDPILNPSLRVIREVKFGGENGPRSERDSEDFLLKSQVVELFEQFDRLGEGMIEVLEIKHGLPFRMQIVVTRPT